MRIATSSFGPFDVRTIAEIFDQIDGYADGEAIFVKDVERLEPETPAAVTSDSLSGEDLARDLGFRYFGDVDDAREAIERFGPHETTDEWRALLEDIEEWCM